MHIHKTSFETYILEIQTLKYQNLINIFIIQLYILRINFNEFSSAAADNARIDYWDKISVNTSAFIWEGE